FEIGFQANHLGHFLLTNLLLPALQKSTLPGRIVNVASTQSDYGKVDLQNLNSEKSYPGTSDQYNNTKTTNIVFTAELARRLSKSTDPTLNSLRTNTVCPGFLYTNLGNDVMEEKMNELRKQLGAGPASQGPLSSVFAACSVEAGQAPAGEFRFYDPKAKVRAGAAVCEDVEIGKGLWEASKEMVGEGILL
ncbi:Retinol dehydrogenase 12, partial [Gonapodya sp. JEL0774]